MDDPAGLIVLSAISLCAIVTAFTGLVWAAIQDGRENPRR